MFTDGIADVLPGGGDDGEEEEEGGGGGVVEPKDAGVYRDPVRLDEALQAPEYVQHPLSSAQTLASHLPGRTVFTGFMQCSKTIFILKPFLPIFDLYPNML